MVKKVTAVCVHQDSLERTAIPIPNVTLRPVRMEALVGLILKASAVNVLPAYPVLDVNWILWMNVNRTLAKTTESVG